LSDRAADVVEAVANPVDQSVDDLTPRGEQEGRRPVHGALDLVSRRADGRGRLADALTNPVDQALHDVAARLGKHCRRRMDPEDALEGIDDRVRSAADRILQVTKESEDPVNGPLDQVLAGLAHVADRGAELLEDVVNRGGDGREDRLEGSLDNVAEALPDPLEGLLNRRPIA